MNILRKLISLKAKRSPYSKSVDRSQEESQERAQEIGQEQFILFSSATEPLNPDGVAHAIEIFNLLLSPEYKGKLGELECLVQFKLAVAYDINEEPETALEHIQIASRLCRGVRHPRISQIMRDELPLSEAIIQSNLGHFSECIQILEGEEEKYRALAQGQALSNILFNRGLCYERMGDFEGALRDYQASLELLPSFDNLNGLAQLKVASPNNAFMVNLATTLHRPLRQHTLPKRLLERVSACQ